MRLKFIILTCTTALVASPVPLHASARAFDPPPQLVAALSQLQRINSLEALPGSIRDGRFVLPNASTATGWVLAAPHAAWNATDAIVDPSLPGRRLIFAACNQRWCVLHYERGGVAHIYYVMALRNVAGAWKMTWLAEGNPAIADWKALEAFLRDPASLNYRVDLQPVDDY